MSIFFRIREYIYSKFPRLEKWHKERNGFYAIHFDKKTKRWLFESLEFKDVNVELVKYTTYNDKRIRVLGEIRHNGYIIQCCGPDLFLCTKRIIKDWHGLCETKEIVRGKSLDEIKELLND